MDGNYQLGDIVLDNWKLVRKIGAGSFGTVFEAEQKDAFSGKSYQAAIKIITITPDAGEDMDMQYCHEIVEEMLREIDLMYQLKGDSNIVSYEGHTISPTQIVEAGILLWSSDSATASDEQEVQTRTMYRVKYEVQ